MAHARPAAAETILIRFRFPFIVCLGVCPNFEIRVSPGGEVITRKLFPHRTYRFRAKPAKLSAFRRALSAVRPTGEKRLDAECETKQPDGTPDPLADNPRPDDFEVRWTGGRSDARLTGCASTHWPTHAAVQNALRVLGVDPIFGWDKRFGPCGPGRRPEPTEEAASSEDTNTLRATTIVCRPLKHIRPRD